MFRLGTTACEQPANARRWLTRVENGQRLRGSIPCTQLIVH